MYATRSKIKKKKFYALPVFVWYDFSEQRAIISLCSIKIMVFITDIRMFTVRYELTLSIIIQVNDIIKFHLRIVQNGMKPLTQCSVTGTTVCLVC